MLWFGCEKKKKKEVMVWLYVGFNKYIQNIGLDIINIEQFTVFSIPTESLIDLRVVRWWIRWESMNLKRI